MAAITAQEIASLTRTLSASVSQAKLSQILERQTRHVVLGVGHPLYPKSRISMGAAAVSWMVEQQGLELEPLHSIRSSKAFKDNIMYLIPHFHDPQSITRAVYSVLKYHRLKASDLTVVHDDDTKPYGTSGITRSLYIRSQNNSQPYMDALCRQLDMKEGTFRRLWIGTKTGDDQRFYNLNELPRARVTGRNGRLNTKENANSIFQIMNDRERSILEENLYPMIHPDGGSIFTMITNRQHQLDRYVQPESAERIPEEEGIDPDAEVDKAAKQINNTTLMEFFDDYQTFKSENRERAAAPKSSKKSADKPQSEKKGFERMLAKK